MAESRNCMAKTVVSTLPKKCLKCKVKTKNERKYEKHSTAIVKCLNIENAVCLPISTEETFECVSIQRGDLGLLKNVNFYVDVTNPKYVSGQSICIEKIEMSYDFIGLLVSEIENTQIDVNGQVLSLKPKSLYNASIVQNVQTYLFNELEGNIVIELPYLYTNENCSEIKLTTVEKEREFQISNLRIVAIGSIGDNRFTATVDTSKLLTMGTTLIPLSAFDISPITFVSEIRWPREILKEKIDTNITIKNITLTSNYIAPSEVGDSGMFTANIDVFFTANRKLYASNKGSVAVFATSNA